MLTHHTHEPVVLGATTFHLATAGFDVAYAQALEPAAGGDVRIAGRSSTVREASAARVLDEITLDVAPVLLDAGERLLDWVADRGLEPVEVCASSRTTHVRQGVPRSI